ncbi:MAG TPA: VC0807 family protein [Caulobacteraceae bacterium]|nr:VC0807 family protein [Caulobacteraceae bacterium]
MAMTAAPEPAHPRIAGALTWARTNAPKAAVEVGVNFALPFLVYSAAHAQLGDVGALMASSAPPLIWSIAEFARRRRIDALSLLVLAGIVLSLVAFFGGGGVRFLQLRERLVTAAIGCVFLVSAAIGKPLIYQLSRARLARRGAAHETAAFEKVQGDPRFRRAMMVMTLAWGFALLGESVLAAVLVFTLSIKQYMVVSAVVGYSALGGMTAWTFWYARRRITALFREAGAAAGPSPAGNLSQS